ncbi:MAG TPA: Uma2 family endonuclease [Pyrinomonadaceae bacterium]|nr:Uma2 family endonuclease [Pyrinomonadaceae bacterium]
MRNLAVKQNYTLEEYAELEKSSEERLEYFDGSVWSMAGASPKHEKIVGNTITALNIVLRERNCSVYSSNLRVKVPIYKPYRYPDVTALCEQPIFEDFYGLEVLVNPGLIVEILSPSTEAFDQSNKFTCYKSIESFTEYLLISQNRPHVALYTKQSETAWLHREYNRLDESVFLSSLDCEISLAEIYLGIEFPEIEHPRFPFEHPDFR